MARGRPERESGGGGERVSRRQLLGRIATVFGEGAPVDVDEDPVADSASMVSGVVTAVEPRALRLETRDGPVVVDVDREATMWRLGPARLSDYVPGDDVVVEGRWEYGTFVGSSLEVMTRIVSGEITARSASRLETANATIHVNGNTRAIPSVDAEGRLYVAKPLDELAVGDEILASVLFEPTTGEFTAADIGTRAV